MDSRVQTYEHKCHVRRFMDTVIEELNHRATVHDNSKLEEPELSAFNAACDLSSIKYPSPEYDESKKQLGKGLEHHYANNLHHPEHWPNGIRDMNLIDLIEMCVDWKAA